MPSAGPVRRSLRADLITPCRCMHAPHRAECTPVDATVHAAAMECPDVAVEHSPAGLEPSAAAMESTIAAIVISTAGLEVSPAASEASSHATAGSAATVEAPMAAIATSSSRTLIFPHLQKRPSQRPCNPDVPAQVQAPVPNIRPQRGKPSSGIRTFPCARDGASTSHEVIPARSEVPGDAKDVTDAAEVPPIPAREGAPVANEVSPARTPSRNRSCRTR